MKLLVTQFYTCGLYEVHPGEIVDFDLERSRFLLEGGYADEVKPKPQKPSPKRKEAKS